MNPKRRPGIVRPSRQEVKDALRFLAPDDPKVQKKLDEILEKKRYGKERKQQGK